PYWALGSNLSRVSVYLAPDFGADGLLKSRPVFLDELDHGLRLVAGDLLDNVVGSGHLPEGVHLRDCRDVLEQERVAPSAGGLVDPLGAGDVLVANWLAKGLADDLGDLRRRQLDRPQEGVGLSSMRLGVGQNLGDHRTQVLG